ncbi:MAG: SDR family oxidoreductase [Acidobacteriia bacterium]|nr:SDR family oxidoreductase [Terriglobia bacterium]
MRTLVIGGTLFIGRALVKELLQAGHQVSVLHRKPGHDLGKRVGNLMADRNDPASMRAALASERFDVVFDNVYDWGRGTTAKQVESTAKACGDHLSRYVFMSSVAAYGDGLDHVESDDLAPDGHPDLYARNKAMSERALFRMNEKGGFPAVTLRPPYIYGPGNPFYREAFFWDRLRSGRPILVPGDGKRLMQFAYVKDLVRACLLTMESPQAVGHAFNIAHPRAITQSQLVRELGKAAGLPVRLSLVDREKITQAGGNQLTGPLYFGVYFDMPPITGRTEKARKVLGWKATGFRAGLEESYRWHKRNHKRPELDFSFEDALMAHECPQPH